MTTAISLGCVPIGGSTIAITSGDPATEANATHGDLSNALPIVPSAWVGD